MENMDFLSFLLHALLKVFTLLSETFHFRVFQLEDNLKEDALKLKQIKVI